MSRSWKKLVKELKELQKRLVEVAQDLDKSKRERPGVCGIWSPKKVVAHMAGWDKEVIRQFELFQEGLEEAIEHDIDAFNEKSVRERKDLSWEETINELKEIHEQFYEEASEIPPSEISKNEEYIDWMEVQIEHYEHHLAQLEEWDRL